MLCNVWNLLTEAIAVWSSVSCRKQSIFCIKGTSPTGVLPHKSSCHIKAKATHLSNVIWRPDVRILRRRCRSDLICQEVCKAVNLRLQSPSTLNSAIEIHSDVSKPCILRTKFRIAVAHVIEFIESRHSVSSAAESKHIETIKDAISDVC